MRESRAAFISLRQSIVFALVSPEYYAVRSLRVLLHRLIVDRDCSGVSVKFMSLSSTPLVWTVSYRVCLSTNELPSKRGEKIHPKPGTCHKTLLRLTSFSSAECFAWSSSVPLYLFSKLHPATGRSQFFSFIRTRSRRHFLEFVCGAHGNRSAACNRSQFVLPAARWGRCSNAAWVNCCYRNRTTRAPCRDPAMSPFSPGKGETQSLNSTCLLPLQLFPRAQSWRTYHHHWCFHVNEFALPPDVRFISFTFVLFFYRKISFTLCGAMWLTGRASLPRVSSSETFLYSSIFMRSPAKRATLYSDVVLSNVVETLLRKNKHK